MNTFLNEVAQRLLQEHPESLDQVTVVFNNRRPGLFLRRQIEQIHGGTLFLPDIIGIDDLVHEMGKLELVPNEFLLFELFAIHRQLGGDQRKYKTLEEFISFGDMMISDFSEIDLYHVDAEQLFTNLYDLKVIGEWNVSDSHLSPQQKEYLDFYKTLYQYYRLLHERLIGQKKAYRGMAYRAVADQIDEIADQMARKHIYFVGFNTLSKCESTIIQALVRRGIATMISDGDAHYFDDERQEAGLLLRQFAQQFLGVGPFANHFLEEKKTITIADCPENILQAKYAGQLLEKVLKEENSTATALEQTALVLADEQLLIPVLNSLPDEVRSANVSMGFPYVLTHVYELTIKVFELYQHSHQGRFHQKELVDLLSDELIAYLTHEPHLHSKLTAYLNEHPIVYADKGDVGEMLAESKIDCERLMFLFEEENLGPNSLIDILLELEEMLYNCPEMASNRKEREALYCLKQTLDYFTEIQKNYQTIDTLPVLQKVYTRIAKRRSVALYGEPLAGLQILGMLESRNLDFKRIILLSVNEGVLPSGRSNNTLIPFELKRAAGIPTYAEKDAVYANHFYSLIQRAEEITLVYSSESEGMGKGEASRFILQLEEEMGKEPYRSHITFQRVKVSVSNSVPVPVASETGTKTKSIQARLRTMAERGFAPTALNNYRLCPRRFYYENVLSLRESEALNDDMDNSDLGNCVHSILEDIYKIDTDGIIRIETLREQLNKTDALVDEKIGERFRHGHIQEGRNRFMGAVAKIQISNLLKKEIELLKLGNTLKIVQVEEFLESELPIQLHEEEIRVKIQGKADRIDIYNNRLRIVDYKSGRVDDKDLHIKDKAIAEGKISDKWFQVMQYAWIYRQKHPEVPSIVSGIYPLGSLASGFIEATWEGEAEISQDHFERFEKYLGQIVSDIMNPDIPFDCRPSKDGCKYCPMKAQCSEA